MTDIFLSYSRDDIDRVTKVRDALANHGFIVFWDQNIPKGMDWNICIRERLSYARLAVVLWSKDSLQSKPVIQEAAIADQLGRQYPVWLDDLEPSDFTLLGQFTTNAARLTRWRGGDCDAADMHAFLVGLEQRLMPIWATRRLDRLQASLEMETALRVATESKGAAAAAARQDLVDELASARTSLKSLEAKVDNTIASAASDRAALDGATLRNTELERAATEAEQLRSEVGRLEAELTVYRKQPASKSSSRRWLEWPYITSTFLSQRLLRFEPGRIVLPCYRSSDAALVQLPIEMTQPFVVTEDLVLEEDWHKVLPPRSGQAALTNPRSPRTSVSFEEAEQFVLALNKLAGGGFFLLDEREWYFVARTLTGVHPEGGIGGKPLTEWLRADWAEYRALIDPKTMGTEDPGSAYKLVRYDAARADQETQQHFRQRWLRSYRSESLGFRVARRV